MDLYFWFETQTKLFPEAVYLDLIHVRPVGSKRVQRYVLPEKDPASIVSQALTLMQKNARQHAGGQQIYALALVNPEDNETVSEFRITSGDQDVGAAHDSELPNAEGIIKQILRFNSNLHRETRMGFDVTQRAIINENTRLRERCEQLEERHMQVMALQEELLSTRHERELMAVQAMRAEGRKDKALSQVATLAPVVARRVLGVGQDPAAVDPLIAQLGGSLTDAQIQSLMSILSPAQQIAAYELFLKQRAQQQKKSEGAAPPEPQSAAG
jgi:hypothetical protein